MAKKNTVKVNKDGWKRLLKRVTPLGDYDVNVGILTSKGGDEVHAKAVGEEPITLLELAYIHEFGSPKANIPERSFIRRTFNEPEGKKELGDFYAKLAKAVVDGKLTAAQAIERLGMKMQTMVKNRITVYGLWPPNKPETVRRKGSSTPLVDTGQLVDAISYEVTKKK